MAEPVPGKYNAAHFFKRKSRVVSKKGKRDQNLKYRFTILMAQKSPHIVQPSVSAGIRSARICLVTGRVHGDSELAVPVEVAAGVAHLKVCCPGSS